jgi:uncharacterized membrane protein (UPF0127 family)
VTPEPKLIVNLTRGSLVCEHVVLADKARQRMRGLLGRRSLPAGEGLLLQPAPSIHTAFMRFPIDVVFLDRNLQVVKLVPNCPAWRVTSALDARSTLELAAGEIARRGVSLGDLLVAVDPNVDPGATPCSAPGTPELGRRADTNGDRPDLESTGRSPQPGSAATVLLVSPDRRFRSVASTLLSRRGVETSVRDRMRNVDELAHRLGVDVVVLDAGSLPIAAALQAARLESLEPHVGVVVVSDVRNKSAGALRVVPKWDSVDELVDAIKQARLSRDRLEI